MNSELDNLLNKLIDVLDRLHPLASYSQQRQIESYKDFLSSVPRQLFKLDNDLFPQIHEETEVSILATLTKGIKVLKHNSRNINNALNKKQRIKYLLRRFNIGVKYNIESYCWRNGIKLEKLVKQHEIDEKLAIKERYEKSAKEMRERVEKGLNEKLRIEREAREEKEAYEKELQLVERELTRINRELSKTLTS